MLFYLSPACLKKNVQNQAGLCVMMGPLILYSRQGILEQQIKDEVTRLQQKLKQKGIELIQKLKADTNEKMTWFLDFKQKNVSGHARIITSLVGK